MSHSLTAQTRKIALNIINTKSRNNFNSKITPNLKALSTSNNYVSKRFNHNICWKCGRERKSVDFFCENCHVIQNPQQTNNYFEVFDMEEKFGIDQKILKEKFRKLQSAVHPDKFSTKSEEEKNISAHYSSLLNKAYSNLQVPIKRAEHLLQLKGEEIGEDHTIDDPEFLMQMMELNEEVENAKPDELRELDLKNRSKLEEIASEIDKCFKQHDVAKAKHYIVKMKYYSSLSNRINGLLREFGVVD